MESSVHSGFLPMSEDDRFRRPKGFLSRQWQDDNLECFRKKYAASRGIFFAYALYAGTGAGKTDAAAMMAMDVLRRKVADRITVIVPTRTILRAVKARFKQYGIHLAAISNKRHRSNGDGLGNHGAILTYGSLSKDHFLQQTLCQAKRTLVIFDEIHHLGEKQDWAEKAVAAFDGVAWGVIGMSGTPFRSDDRPMPFLTYKERPDGKRVLIPDFAQSLGKCILDHFCREPKFDFFSPKIMIRQGDAIIERSFDEVDISDKDADLVLAESVRTGARARKRLTQRALKSCLRKDGTRKKIVIFVDRKEDASVALPMELARYGIKATDIVTITSDDRDALEKIEKFGKGEAWIMIAVDMMSEGANIPELEVALFLSKTTAPLKTIQRVGRALRGTGYALVFMFRDPRYVRIACQIEDEQLHALKLRESPPPRERGNGNGNGGSSGPEVVDTTAYPDGTVIAGTVFSESQHLACYRYCERNDLDPQRDLPTVILLMRKGKLPLDDAGE